MASLIGSLVLSEVWSAALRSEHRRKQSRLLLLQADEAHNCLHGIDLGFVSFRIQEISASSRFLAWAILSLQIPNIEAAFGNYSTWITYRLGGEDALLLEKEFAVEGLAKQIVNLPSFHFIARKLEHFRPVVSDIVTARKKVKKFGDEPPRGAERDRRKLGNDGELDRKTVGGNDQRIPWRRMARLALLPSRLSQIRVRA